MATATDSTVEFAQPTVSGADPRASDRTRPSDATRARDEREPKAEREHEAERVRHGEDVVPQADPFMPDVDTLPDPADGPLHGAGSLEVAAEMDYPEHERTYSLFLSVTKWGILVVVSLLIAMAIGFYGGGGLLGGGIAFLALLGASAILF